MLHPSSPMDNSRDSGLLRQLLRSVFTSSAQAIRTLRASARDTVQDRGRMQRNEMSG